MSTERETLCTIALTRLHGIGLHTARTLLETAGSAALLFDQPQELPRLMPGATPRLLRLLADHDEAFLFAQAEYAHAIRNGYRCLPYWDEDYPARLRECVDAPTLLYYRGTANLNATHTLSIVGTRRMTDYGRRICENFLHDLAELCPDALVVSGLAYGVDICAHRAALANGLDTVGVLAHGMDRIYPPVHRDTAAQMTRQGGVLTEFPIGTNPNRQNFVRRNRIVAGMCEATIVVESAAKGGALITAGMAGSYNRECFAFPGRVGDSTSEGCNKLILQNSAMLLTSAEDLVQALNWHTATGHSRPIQRELFPELTAEQEKLYRILRQHPDGIQINTLVVESETPVYRLTSLLFELELKGLVRPLFGGIYQPIL